MLDVALNVDPIFFTSLIIIGFLIGVIAAMVGIGGGLILVPLLVIVFSLNTQEASAISLFVIMFTSSSGSYAYYKQKRIDLRTGIFFAVIVVPSSFVGSFVASKIDPTILIIIFGLLLLAVSSQRIYKLIIKLEYKTQSQESLNREEMPITFIPEQKNNILPHAIEKRSIIDSDGKTFIYNIKLRRTLLGAFFGGFLGGLLGVGGGIIFVPVLLSSGVPPHIAVATSSFIIIFTAISGSLARLLYGTVLFDYAIPLIIGTVIGARLGATRVKKISSEKVLIMFYLIVFLSGVRMIFKAFGLFP